ncbi:unnamed protein product [Toxocara canis]|uniref:Villin-1 n=1 Tax=Toxocara canis TaxID=6265 RepID=A0A183V9H5_TOXCA|nr:unnamed protein product [Toxocara canis]
MKYRRVKCQPMKRHSMSNYSLSDSDHVLVYSSVWATWSAWSFCVNNVRIRVRACNTVRGFSCLGSNQEHMECEMKKASEAAVHESDYDAVDPWEADRKEAMRQLYPDYEPDEPKPKPKAQLFRTPNFAQLSQPHPPRPVLS